MLRPGDEAIPWRTIGVVRHGPGGSRSSSAGAPRRRGRARPEGLRAQHQPRGRLCLGGRDRRGGLEQSTKRSDDEHMTEEIRQIIADHGRLSVDAAELAPDADLYHAGMTSHASVNVMLALEDHFDVEFPDRMLKRSVFESIAAIEAALERAARRDAGVMSVSVDRDQAFLERRRARSPTSSPRRTPTRSTATRASRSRRSTRCARSARCRRSSRPSSAAAASSFEAIAAACFELGRRCGASAMVFAMHQIQVAHDRAPPRRRRRGSRTTCATVAREQRLIASVTSEVGTGGDMGRSIAAVDRRRGRARARSRSRRRRSATAPTPTTCS